MAKKPPENKIIKLNLQDARSSAMKLLAEAQAKSERASVHLEKSDYAGAIQEAVDSMERSAKGIVALVLHEWPRVHRLRPKYNVECLKELETHLDDSQYELFVDCAKVLLWAHTWASLHEISQWGFDEARIATRRLFSQWDAEAARHYADFCTTVLHRLILVQAFRAGLAEECK